MPSSGVPPATRVAGIFALITGVWIVFSDRVARDLVAHVEALTTLQTYKGLGFTAVMAASVYVIANRRDRVRLRLERELGNARAALEQQETLRDSFLTALSHEMRTPLTTLVGAASILERRERQLSEEQSRELVHRLAGASRRLDRFLASLERVYQVAADVRPVSRRETGLTALVRDVVARFPAGTHRLEVEPGAATAYVDPQLFELLVEHLVSNVVRHTPPGTRAWIRIAPSPRGVTVDVEDSGPGIPEEMSRAIFEPFKQIAAQDHAPGVGIGLAVVDRIASMHGGYAWLEQRTGGGACFRVFLPQRQRRGTRLFSLVQRRSRGPVPDPR